MNILFQVVVFVGVAMVLYAIYGIFSSRQVQVEGQHPRRSSKEPESFLKEQKILRLEGQIGTLETESQKVKAEYANTQKELEIAKSKELQLQQELARRQEWVNKSESELSKLKQDNLNLQNKLSAKVKESEEEFTKNVNLNRELQEIKTKMQSLQNESRQKSDQIEAQKHQIERNLNEIKEHLETIAEFKKKEQISEWVPKIEFNNLNAEYTALEKELEVKEVKLKSLAEELMQLKNQLSKKEELQIPPEVKEIPKQKEA